MIVGSLGKHDTTSIFRNRTYCIAFVSTPIDLESKSFCVESNTVLQIFDWQYWLLCLYAIIDGGYTIIIKKV